MEDGMENDNQNIKNDDSKWYKTGWNNFHSHTWNPQSKFTSINSRHKHEVYVEKMETDTQSIKLFGLITISHKHKLTMKEK